MAARIYELKAQRKALATEANAALDKVQATATAENRALTAEELAAQDAFDTRLAALDAQIALQDRKDDRDRKYGSALPAEPGAREVPGSGIQVQLRAENDPKRGFATPRDFFLAAIDNSGLRDRADVTDERLASLAVMDKDDKAAAGELAFMLPDFRMKATVGSDEQGEYSDTYGGFAVPRTRAPGLLQVGFEGDPTAGLTQNVPMASPAIDMVARTDKDHTSSVAGGFTVARRAETTAASSSRMALEMVSLKASSLFGLAYATEELLADSPISFAALIDTGFRTQMGAHILNEKIRGLGGTEYIGVLNAACAVEIAKETNQAADTIVFDNVNKMAARCWGLGSAIWLANHDARTQLVKISLPIGTGGVAMYQPSQASGFPDMLWGRPVLYSEYMPTVGDAGDIAIVNWSQYLEGVYQPIQSAESIHVRFVNHERTFKLWTRNCGAPWWRSALTPNKGSNTLSPIVTLAART
jgi:HK97 family phage major capsid protein